MQTQYKRGRAREYKIMNRLKEKGWLAIRSAGSHSPVDIVAINEKTREIWLIQVKPKSMSQSMKDILIAQSQAYNGFFKVRFGVVSTYSELKKEE